MYKIGKIINQEGVIIETVSFNPESKEIQYYELKDGEMLVENDNTKGYIKPKWTGTDWIESATEQEIEEANQPIEDENATSLEAEVAELRATVDALLGVENE